MKDLLKIILFPVLVLAVNYLVDSSGIYLSHQWVDIPLHFAGGLAIAISFWVLLRIAEKQGYIKTNAYLSFIIILFAVTTAAVIWEFYEFGLEYFFSKVTQPSVADTMADFFFGMLGGMSGWFISYYSKL